jgi:hypothetical protein
MNSTTLFLHYLLYKRTAASLGWDFVDFEQFRNEILITRQEVWNFIKILEE